MFVFCTNLVTFIPHSRFSICIVLSYVLYRKYSQYVHYRIFMILKNKEKILIMEYVFLSNNDTLAKKELIEIFFQINCSEYSEIFRHNFLKMEQEPHFCFRIHKCILRIFLCQTSNLKTNVKRMLLLHHY